MLGSFQLSLDWRGSENYDLRKTQNVYSTGCIRKTPHTLNAEYQNSQAVYFNVPGTCFNELLTPDFIWFKKYVLGTQGWSLVVKMDAFKCKSVADGWENTHLPFNIDQSDQEALHWHINGQKSSSHCFNFYSECISSASWPWAALWCRTLPLRRVTCVDREIFATCPASHKYLS